MSTKTSAWCKSAQHALIDKEISKKELAEALGLSRSYVSQIINGKHYSEAAVKRISDFLGIEDSDSSTLSTH